MSKVDGNGRYEKEKRWLSLKGPEHKVKKKKVCTTCYSTRKIQCGSCSGLGTDNIRKSKEDSPCSRCRGTGKVFCFVCMTPNKIK